MAIPTGWCFFPRYCHTVTSDRGVIFFVTGIFLTKCYQFPISIGNTGVAITVVTIKLVTQGEGAGSRGVQCCMSHRGVGFSCNTSYRG